MKEAESWLPPQIKALAVKPTLNSIPGTLINRIVLTPKAFMDARALMNMHTSVHTQTDTHTHRHIKMKV